MSTTGLQFPTLDKAIQTMEGFYPGSLSYRNQNPGNIVAGSFAAQFGGTAGAGGFAQFPDLASGTAAEDALLGLYAQQGLTIGQAVQKWTGGTAPPTYAPYVAGQAGATVNTPLSALQGAGAAAGTSGTTGGWLGALGGALQGAISSTPAGVGTSMLARAACFIIGIILLVFAFRGVEDTKQTVVNVVSKAKDVAAVAE